MRQIREPDEDCAQERADHLGEDIKRDRPFELSNHGERNRDGRIQVSAANCADRVDGQSHGQRPTGRNDNPAAGVTFGALEHGIGNHAIAQHDQ